MATMIDWDSVKVVPMGGEIRVHCPFCELSGKSPDRRRHLYIDPYDEVYHCFRCGASGRLGRILDYPARMIWLRSLTHRRGSVSSSVSLPPSLPVKVDPVAVEYLVCRGVDPDAFLGNIRVGIGDLEGMLLFPCVWMGEVKYWTARRYKGIGKRNVSSPGLKWPFWNLRRYEGRLWIVEGVFDLLHNDLPGMALLGKSLSGWWETLIMMIHPSSVVVALDADAGDAADRIAHRLSGLVREVSVCRLSEGDPGNQPMSILTNAIRPYGVSSSLEVKNG